MKHYLDISLHNHKIFETFLDSYEADRLFKIPEGFGNNLFWNMAHTVAVQQLLTYGRAGITPALPQSFLEAYKPGTTPPTENTSELIKALKSYLYKGVQQIEADVAAGKFDNFETYTTRTGYEINSIEKALHFNNYHEGIHMGYLLCLKKFV